MKALIARWTREGVSSPSGASDTEILALQGRFGLCLPRSFRDYLHLVNGMTDGDTSGDLVHFWNLNEISQHLSEPDSLHKYPFLPFADYSINCWAWVLPVEPNGDVTDAVFTYGPPLEPCATTFLSFVARYLGGDDLAPKRLARPVRLHWKGGT